MRVFVALFGLAAAISLQEHAHMNPIRRVVSILQKMQEKCKEEGRKDEELTAKFQCYCKNGSGKLTKAIDEEMEAQKEQAAEANQKTARVDQLKQEVAQHKHDRADAKDAIEKADAIRAKEKKEFEKNDGDESKDITAMKKAIAALEKGSGKAFLQVSRVDVGLIQRSIEMSNSISDGERSTVIAFLASPYGDYQASSGEIVGILKEMLDEMSRDYDKMVEDEKTSAKNHAELVKAKQQQIAGHTKSIEKKSVRQGELAVEATKAKNAAENAGNEAEANRKMAANLGKNCEKEEKASVVRQKKRQQEIVAISEAIKILNNDDALDVFKKTLKSPATPAPALIQTDTDPAVAARMQAQSLIQGAVSASIKPQRLSLLTYLLRVGKVDFGKVIKMIDNMVTELLEEQKDDTEHLEFCDKEFDSTSDDKKETERDLKDLIAKIDELDSRMSKLKDEMEKIKKEMIDSADSAAEATDLRKKEHAEFEEEKVQLIAAKQLIGKAQNRLYKFYEPALYKPPPVRELTEQERIAQNMGETIATPAPTYIAGTKVALNLQQKVDIGEAPKTATFEKNTGQSSGVCALMGMLVKELDADFQKKQHDEEVAQRDYEQEMEDTKKQTEENKKSLTQKENDYADSESALNDAKTSRGDENKQLEALNDKIAKLHKDCDFLMKNFDYRKEARTREIEGLRKAKAVLSGANYN